jgi:hypothetical protein
MEDMKIPQVASKFNVYASVISTENGIRRQ